MFWATLDPQFSDAYRMAATVATYFGLASFIAAKLADPTGSQYFWTGWRLHLISRDMEET